MKVVIRHDDTWLLIKEIYAIRRQSRKRGRKQQRSTSIPYGMVAVSVDEPPINGMRYRVEIEVPATKATRFAIKMFQAPGNAVVVIEPHGKSVDRYIARIYAPSRAEAERVGKLAESVIAQLRTKRGRGEETEAGEVEELEEEEEEAGEE